MEARRKRVLVVDDEPFNLRALAEHFKQDYQVILAKSGAEALRQARREPQPDIILLDVVMPGMDGLEVCQALKADPETRGIPIIFVTALEEQVDEERGLELGAVDYITKPVRPAIVRARVRIHLEREQLIRDLQEAMVNVKTLSGLIPICSWCRKVRDDHGYWMKVEQYLQSTSGASVTHGICPDCVEAMKDE